MQTRHMALLRVGWGGTITPLVNKTESNQTRHPRLKTTHRPGWTMCPTRSSVYAHTMHMPTQDLFVYARTSI